MSDPTKNQLDAAFRLRRVIVLISEKQPSYARSVIDQYLRFITTSPGVVRGNGVEFPQTVRRHVASEERCSVGTGKYPLLYFHIGNTILAFYRLEADPITFEGRLSLLERIANDGIGQYVPHGDDQTGYKLVTVEDAKAANAKRAEELSQKAFAESSPEAEDLKVKTYAEPEGDDDAVPDQADGDDAVHDGGGSPGVRLARPPGLQVRPRKGDGH